MINNRWIYRFIALAVGAISFILGFQYAIGAPTRLIDFSFTEFDDHSRLVIETEGPPGINLTYDKDNRRLNMRLISVEGTELFEGAQYSDALIESILKIDDESEGTLITVNFKFPEISFYSSTLSDGNGIQLDFRKREKPLRITGITPDQIVKSYQPTQPDNKQAASPDQESQTEPKQSEQHLAKLNAEDTKYKQLEFVSGRDLFKEYMKLVQQKKYDEAREKADEFILTYPDSVYIERVYFSRADTYYMDSEEEPDHRQKSIAAYNEAIAMFPDSPLVQQALMRKGNLYGKQEFNIEALSEYGGLIKHAPDGKYRASAMLARAKIFIRQEKFQKAYNELEQILVLFPSRREVSDAKYLIAESFYDRGNYETANTIFKEAVAVWPAFPRTHPTTFYKIADTKYQLGEKGKAVDDWYSIINIFPSATESRNSMIRIGDTYLEHDKKRKAAQMYERLIKHYPKNDEAVMARLRLASLGVDNPELLKHSEVFDYSAFENPHNTFNDILENYPAEKFLKDALLRKGKAYFQQKRYLASILAYKELLKAFPSDAMSGTLFSLVKENFIKMIETYYEQDGFMMVLLVYYNNFDPFLRSIEDPGILAKIADSYKHMTLYDRAIEYYSLTSEYDHDGRLKTHVVFNIAKTYLLAGELDKAKDMLTKYVKNYPLSKDAVSARHLLGDAYFGQGNTTQAIASWRLAIEADLDHPRLSRTAYNLAKALKASRQNSFAVDTFNLAIDTYKPQLKTGIDADYVVDSYYQLAETYYLDHDYPRAIRSGEKTLRRYPGHKRNSWMQYIISSSYQMIDKNELAMEGLKVLATDSDDTTIRKVATAKLEVFEWKKKNPEIFQD